MSLYSDNKIKQLFLTFCVIKMHLLNVKGDDACSQRFLCQYILCSYASLIDLMSSATRAYFQDLSRNVSGEAR
jgi:hypothetical protein